VVCSKQRFRVRIQFLDLSYATIASPSRPLVPSRHTKIPIVSPLETNKIRHQSLDEVHVTMWLRHLSVVPAMCAKVASPSSVTSRPHLPFYARGPTTDNLGQHKAKPSLISSDPRPSSPSLSHSLLYISILNHNTPNLPNPFVCKEWSPFLLCLFCVHKLRKPPRISYLFGENQTTKTYTSHGRDQ
jgi:hypothetical protein